MADDAMTTRCRRTSVTGRGNRFFPSGSGFTAGIIFLIGAVIHTSAFATTLTINLQISNIVHHFTPPNPPFGLSGHVDDEIVYDHAGLTNVNLSEYSTFELRFFAATGKEIAVNATNFISSVNLVYLAADDTFTH